MNIASGRPSLPGGEHRHHETEEQNHAPGQQSTCHAFSIIGGMRSAGSKFIWQSRAMKHSAYDCVFGSERM
jgi:hypothetical protein